MKLYLSGKRGKDLYTLIDDEDYDLVKNFSWSLSTKGYAQAYVPKKYRDKYKIEMIHMQKLLMFDKIKEGTFVDHINRNKLDNRKCNLRIVSMSENNQNRGKIYFNNENKITSKYKGVFWDRTRWRAAITVHGKKIYLGSYQEEEQAAEVYNRNAIKYFGKDAFINKQYI